MTEKVGQLNDILIFLQEHFCEKMPEGVRMHLP